jgi:hypothetical protein
VAWKVSGNKLIRKFDPAGTTAIWSAEFGRPGGAEPFVFESHRAHRGIFPATTNCLGLRAVSTGREIHVKG